MKAAIRINSLTLEGGGPKSLSSMEAHGKREDQSSQRRRVRDDAPLVFGTLDLRAAYDEHVDGCRMNAGLKRPAMHAIVQFPPQLGRSPANREIMLHLAVKYINETHGGQAVFAARLDQDEEGLATVDVFYAPKYLKEGKRRSEMWISTSRHAKEIAEKHREEITRRNRGTFSTTPRHIGIAMQAELYAFLVKSGLKLESRTEKKEFDPDRLEPEVGKARRDARAEKEVAARMMQEAQAAEQTLRVRQEEAEAERVANLARAEAAWQEAELAREAAEAAERAAAVRLEEADAAKASMAEQIEIARKEAAAEAATAAVELMTAALTGKTTADTPMKRLLWPVIRPVMARFTSWWQAYRGRVEALPAAKITELTGALPIAAPTVEDHLSGNTGPAGP